MFLPVTLRSLLNSEIRREAIEGKCALVRWLTVIQSQRNWYHSKAYMLFLLKANSNLSRISFSPTISEMLQFEVERLGN